MKNISIILPVHNEASGIEKYIQEIITAMSRSSISYEVVCIENGSTDESLAILKRLAKQYDFLNVYQSEKGWGSAVRKGIQVAKGTYTCYMVSDGQIDPIVIPDLYKTIGNSKYGMVKISRASRENMKRFINSRAYNFIARVVFGLPTTDVNGTPKILLTSLAQKMKLESHNIAIDLELLIKLKMNNILWREVFVESRNRESGISTTNIKSVVEMLRYMNEFRKKKSAWSDLI